MQVIEGQTFAGKHDRNSGKVFSDLELRDCYFEGSSFSTTRDVKLRSTLRNSKIIQCSQRGSSIGPAIIEDVLVDGLKTNSQLLQMWGAVFKHVTIKGKVDRLMFSPFANPSEPEGDVNRTFARANAEYYKTVDWALDISEVEVQEIDIRGIPARLVRRDPETQIVVTRQKAMKLQSEYRKITFPKVAPLDGYLDLFLGRNDEPDRIFIAPRARKTKMKDWLEAFRLLREVGVAEPD